MTVSAYTDYRELYDLLLDYTAPSRALVEEILIGQVWTCCISDNGVGLAMTPADGPAARTLPWSGTLRGKPVRELAGWVKSWQPQEAAIGLAACNAALQTGLCLPQGQQLRELAGKGNLAVFEHFLPQLGGRKIVVIGRYPGLRAWAASQGLDLTILERLPEDGDLPAAAAEFLLPQADWVFLTASAISNKTLPRLLELSRPAMSVLMGPSTPWLPEFFHYGVNYLAGVEIADREVLHATVAEGGGVRIFDAAVCYRVAELTPANTWDWLRRAIAQTIFVKDRLSQEMEQWYARQRTPRYPRFAELEAVGQKLSRLDTCAHELWARHPQTSPKTSS